MQGGNQIMSTLRDKYLNEVLPKMQEQLKIGNKMSVPNITKIVLNVGVGDARDNQTALDKLVADMAALAGQKPVVTKAKKSISGFKLAQGQPVGLVVTLRGERMYNFFEKLVTLVLPKVRDFQGVSTKSFDGQGNFTLGLREQSIFPEIAVNTSNLREKSRGLEISFVTTAKNKEESKLLLDLLGMPFIKGVANG